MDVTEDQEEVDFKTIALGGDLYLVTPEIFNFVKDYLDKVTEDYAY